MPGIKDEWRLIVTPARAGSWNMAVDEALLYSVGKGESPPVLRLYRWEPACLSLGMAQPASDIDFERLTAYGWDWVRRPTGGRAILHTDELTYSVTSPLSEPRLAGSVLESYLRISRALLHALALLGLPASAREGFPGRAGSPTGPVCFNVPSTYEITVAGKKLIGSAQARRKEGILQHGSLPLRGALTRITQALNYPNIEARNLAADQLLEHATTVEMALGRLVSWEEAATAFEQAFAEVLDLEFIQGELKPVEIHLAQEICEAKYANDAWNARI